jgi:acetylglutamate kinase
LDAGVEVQVESVMQHNGLKYLGQYRGKTFVIKYGGSIMKNLAAREAFIRDIGSLRDAGISIVIVHGGGPNISNLLDRLNISSTFVKGLRVTDKAVMEAVEMALSGQVNKELVGSLCVNGTSAIGLSGRDGNLLEAERKCLYENGEEIDIGYVGEVVNVNTRLLDDLMNIGQVLVISPVGCDREGNVYNINADYAAAAISGALRAEKLILLSDVEGLYGDMNDKSTLIRFATVKDIKMYMEIGVIAGGMIPKMESCIKAMENGTASIHLLDGRVEHCLIYDLCPSLAPGGFLAGTRLAV